MLANKILSSPHNKIKDTNYVRYWFFKSFNVSLCHTKLIYINIYNIYNWTPLNSLNN